MIRSACRALVAITLLAGSISSAAAQYPMRGGPIYGGPFAGGGPSLFVGAYAPPYYPYPLTGAGFGPSYLGAAPYAGGYANVPVGVPVPYYLNVPNIVYPKPQWTRQADGTPIPVPQTSPGGPAEGSRSEPTPLQPPASLMPGRAHFTVTVPTDAKVWVNDAETKNTGTARRFHTPATLEAGKTYEYSFRAQWPESGQTVTRDRTVQFKAGDDLAVDFTQVPAR